MSLNTAAAGTHHAGHAFATGAERFSTPSSPLAFGREDRRALASHDLSRPGGQGKLCR
jgi:hypothetical protein